MKNLIISLAIIMGLCFNAVGDAAQDILKIKETLGLKQPKVYIELNELTKSPKAYYNKEITIKALYKGPGKLFLPNLSAFTSEQFLNFHIWPDRAQLWTDNGIRSLFTTCYISRYNQNFNKLRSMPMYTPIIINARVDGVVENIPLLEVLDISFIKEPQLNKYGINQMRKAYAWLAIKRYDTASLHFKRALKESLPLWANLEIKSTLGDISFDLKLYNQARKQYLEVLQLGANRSYILPRLIKAILASNNANSMANIGRLGYELSQLTPDNPWGHLAFGIGLYQNKEYHQALRSLQRALFRNQNILYTYIWKARTFTAIEETTSAISSYLDGLNLFENNLILNSELAQIYLNEQKYKKALPYFHKLTKNLAPQSAYYPWCMAKCQLGLNNQSAAITSLKIALKRNPKYYEALIALGSIHFTNKRYEQAKAYLNRAIKIKPQSIEAYIKLGFIAWQENNLTLAEEFFNKALIIDATNQEALTYLGKINWQQNKIELALQRFNQLVDLAPKNYPTRLDLAKRAQQTKHYAMAIKHFTILSNVIAYKESALFALSVNHIALKQYSQAQKNLEDLIAHNPRNLAAINNLSYLCSTKLQKYKLGLKYAKMALKLTDKNPAVLDSLAIAYLYNNQALLAQQTLIKAQKLKPLIGNSFHFQNSHLKALITYHLAMSLYAQQKYKDSLKQLYSIKNTQGQLKQDIAMLKSKIISDIAKLKAKSQKTDNQKKVAATTNAHEKKPANLKPVTKESAQK